MVCLCFPDYFFANLCGSFDFANPPVPVIKSFQNERIASSGVLKNFKIKEPFVLGF
jgi:hypothetical protein